MNFPIKVGDWVIATRDLIHMRIKKGMVGRVLEMGIDGISIEFVDDVGGHGCGGKGKYGHCWWWFNPIYLKKISKKEAVLYAL